MKLTGSSLAVQLAIVALLMPGMACAQWVYEFELGYMLPNSDRLLIECERVVQTRFVDYYIADGRPLAWTNACGNRQPVYTHFIGRRCWKPLPRLVFECGWRHFSSPFDHQEITFDAAAIRGRFGWGAR